MKSKAILIALLASLGGMGAARAAPVTWTLQDWVFADGGTASGSFVFDDDTDLFSDIMIATTAGSTLAGASYGVPAPGFVQGFLNFVPASSADLTGSVVISVFLPAPLTNAGGTVLVDLTAGLKGEFTCTNAVCTNRSAPSRLLVSGSVTSEIPLPAALPLFLAGLAGLGLTGRKRIKPAAEASRAASARP